VVGAVEKREVESVWMKRVGVRGWRRREEGKRGDVELF
jgi:hypothetical protein